MNIIPNPGKPELKRLLKLKKSEYRNPKQIQNSKDRMSDTKVFSSSPIWKFELVPKFACPPNKFLGRREFRASNLPT
jgi:hypothetical protein